MIHRAWAIGVLMLSTLVQANPLFFGRDERVRMPVQQAPWSALGQLETRSGQICTVSLVAAQWALTAGHCLFDEKGRPDPVISVEFGLEGERVRAHIQVVRSYWPPTLRAGLRVHADGLSIRNDATKLDYALLHLKLPVPARIAQPIAVFKGDQAALRLALDQAGWRVTQAGYPDDDQTHLLGHRGCRVTALTANHVLTHRCDTLAGDSGSPLLMQQGKQWVLIGVQSSAPATADRATEDNRAASVTGMQDWLHQHLPD